MFYLFFKHTLMESNDDGSSSQNPNVEFRIYGQAENQRLKNLLGSGLSGLGFTQPTIHVVI